MKGDNSLACVCFFMLDWVKGSMYVPMFQSFMATLNCKRPQQCDGSLFVGTLVEKSRNWKVPFQKNGKLGFTGIFHPRFHVICIFTFLGSKNKLARESQKLSSLWKRYGKLIIDWKEIHSKCMRQWNLNGIRFHCWINLVPYPIVRAHNWEAWSTRNHFPVPFRISDTSKNEIELPFNPQRISRKQGMNEPDPSVIKYASVFST